MEGMINYDNMGYSCKTTQNSKEVRYIVADLDCVKVESITGSVLFIHPIRYRFRF